MSDIVKVANDLDLKLDLTEIARLEELRKDIPSIGVMDGGMFMRDFTTACTLFAKLIEKVQIAVNKATMDVAHEEAKAKLERAPLYFAEKKILEGAVKDSMSLRETYLALDDKYRAAKEKQGELKALLDYLNNKLDFYKMDHYTAKAIYDKLPQITGPVGMKSGGKMGVE